MVLQVSTLASSACPRAGRGVQEPSAAASARALLRPSWRGGGVVAFLHAKPQSGGSQARRGLSIRAMQEVDDIAVFRFTLGIPGFDDRLIPRAIGFLGGTLLAVNHAVVGAAVSEAQGRTELVAAALVALCIATPTISLRLKEAGAGRGGASSPVAGAAEVFKLAEGVGEGLKKELAWSSFALLRNTNSRGILVVKGGECLMARGAVKPPTSDPAQLLPLLSAALAPAVAAAAAQGGGMLYMPSRGAIQQAGADKWDFVPSGAETLAVQPLEGGGALVLIGDRPRALSPSERKWVVAIGEKLAGAA